MKKIYLLLLLLGQLIQVSAYSGYTHWYVNSTPQTIKIQLRYLGTGSLGKMEWCGNDTITLQPEGLNGDRVSRRPDVCSISTIRPAPEQGVTRFASYEPKHGFAGSAVFHFEQANPEAPVTLTRKSVSTKIPRRAATK